MYGSSFQERVKPVIQYTIIRYLKMHISVSTYLYFKIVHYHSIYNGVCRLFFIFYFYFYFYKKALKNQDIKESSIGVYVDDGKTNLCLSFRSISCHST